MSGIALIALPVVAGIGLVGLLLVVTGFYMPDDTSPELPAAQVVRRGASPIRSRPPTGGELRVSATRIVVGVMIMMCAGTAIMFLLGDLTLRAPA